MSTLTDVAGSDAAPVAHPDDSLPATHDEIQCAHTDDALPQKKTRTKNDFPHSPPDSNNTNKSDASDSELSDLEDEPILSDAPMPDAPAVDNQDGIGEVLPDHWSGSVPVFKPTMHQFKDFKRFMEAVDSYGMQSGIIKIIPPQEWKDSLPPIDELVKRVKVREPIKQDIMGSSGTYRQVNILHGRSYNLPQWRQLCDQSEHQPPARRGERRANAGTERVRALRNRAAAPRPTPASTSTNSSDPPKRRGRGRPPKAKAGAKTQIKEEQAAASSDDRPMTPVSPKAAEEEKAKPVESIEAAELGEPVDDDEDTPRVGRMAVARPPKSKTQSTSARRKYSRREGSAAIDEAAFKDWDYRMDVSNFTPERCEELERVYWKTLTYAPPLYGADLMGTLFDESTELWNLNKLPNLLDVLGTKVPGVNTAYLYLGMWKATFAWHLEDVDLYSINYLHFGAPKQWYSISQKDARRFEAAMKSIWPHDAKACDQFLRHKAFLISPHHLQQHYGIKVNKCLSYPGEFVVTYPYGYHSGYNLGYNCAEAVNFALDSWLDLAKIAKKCDCAQAQDSVWVNVYEIERKLRGESTEYEETEDEEDEDDELSGLPTPPGSHGVRFKGVGGKRKRGPGDLGTSKVKKIKLRLKTSAETPCCLCPNDFPFSEFLPTDDGRKAHKLCAMYLPETFIETVDGKETVFNVDNIAKERLDLKCMYCRSRRGACFQCSQSKCSRAYHATCAAAAGVFVEEQDVPVFDKDNTEYKEQAFEFSCRFHRVKRDKKLDGDCLEEDRRIQAAAAALKKGEIYQLQYHRGDIFAGCVVENRAEDRTLLLDILPNGDRVEVDWKWLLLPDPTDYHLPKASANALPMPATRKAKELLNAKRKTDGTPRKGDVFLEGYTWAEFQTEKVSNPSQVKVDFSKPDQVWHYLGKTSTEYKAQYTEDASNQRHNPRGNFLDTVPKPPRPVPARPVYQTPAFGHAMPYGSPYAAPSSGLLPAATVPLVRPEKPYVYKPRTPVEPNHKFSNSFTTQRFRLAGPPPPPQRPIQHTQYSHQPTQGYQNPGIYSTQRFDVKTPQPPQQPNHGRPKVPDFVGRFHQQLATAISDSNKNVSTIAHPGQPHQSPLPVATPQPVRPQNPPHAKAAWQIHTSVYKRYGFFQVNHNRDPSTYRTPYSPWGGFTNGYEGNLRAHLISNQQELFRRGSLTTGTYPMSNSNTGRQPGQHLQNPIPHSGGVSQQPTTGSSYRANPFSHPSRTGPVAASAVGGASSHQHHHTVIRPEQSSSPTPAHQAPYQQASQWMAHGHRPHQQYPQQSPYQGPQWTASQHQAPAAAQQVRQWNGSVQQAAPQAPHHQMAQRQPVERPAAQQPPQQEFHQQASKELPPQQQPVNHPQAQPNKSQPAVLSAQKAYKAPPKESPVPLPANFLAAITSTTTTPPAAVQAQSASTAPSKGPSQTSLAVQKQRSAASPGKPIAGGGSKIPVTPVPIPQLPGMVSSPKSTERSPANKEQNGLTPSSGRRTRSMSKITIEETQDSASVQESGKAGPNADTKDEPPSFADVPGGGSMDFVERLMQNLRRVSQREGTS